MKGRILISEIVKGDFSKKGESLRRKIKIAVLGSHATLNFLSKKSSKLVNDIYEICFMKEDTSFVDLIPEDLEEIIKSKPDYIIFDLFADVYHVTVQKSQDQEVDYHREASIGVSNGTNNTRTNISYQTSDYSMVFRRSFDRFYHEVRKKLPKTKVIMHRIKLVAEFFENPKHNNLPYHLQNEVNVSFFLLEEITQKFNIKTIDVFSNHKTPREKIVEEQDSYTRFEKKYYNRFMNQLNSICLIDLL